MSTGTAQRHHDSQPPRDTHPSKTSGTTKPGRRLRSLALTGGLLIASLVWIAPLVLLVISAVRPLSDFLSNGPVSWPEDFTLDNFAEAWDVGNFGSSYANSLFLLAIKVPLGVILAALLAYALAKLRIRMKTAMLFFVVIGMTVPIYIAIVPLFTMLRSVGMTDSIPGIVGPYVAFGLPLQVIILHAFFRRVPDELLEAARIDGAGDLKIFVRIMLPLSLPALITVAILDAVATWNELFLALTLLSSQENQTIPLGLLNFQGQFATNYTGLAAGILIAVVPILVLYMFLQKFIVGGLTAGATKG